MKLADLHEEPEVTLELAPLIDVLFLIVLFYAVASSLISPRDLAQLKDHVARLETTSRSLTEDLAGRDRQLDQLKTTLAASGTELAQRERELGDSRTLTQALSQDLSATRHDLLEQRQQLEALSHTADDRGAALSAANARLEDNQRQLDTRERQLAQQSQLMAGLRQRLSLSLAASEAAEAEARRQQQALALTEDQRQQLRRDLEQEQARHQAESTAAAEAVAAAEAGLEQLRQQLAALSAENQQLKAAARHDQERLGGAIEAEQRLNDTLQSLIRNQTLGVTRTQDRLVLELSDKVLFDSGSDELKPAGREVLASVAKVLSERVGALQIQVGGHTDNQPLARNRRFDSNWALSAARAVAVVRLLEQRGIDPARLSALGYGEFQPVAANTSAEGRARNRRIEIVLLAR